MSLPSTLALMTGYFFSAATAALTKKLMKPSLTPCSFSNFSWNFLRISITGAMLTSLKVVRMALVLWLAPGARRRGRAGATSAHAARGGRPGSAPCGCGHGGQRLGHGRVDRGCRRASGGAAFGAACGLRRHGGQHVALGHAAVLAGAGHAAGGQLVVGHQLGGGGHGHVALLPAGALRQPRVQGRWRSRGFRPRRALPSGSRPRCLRCRCGR